LAGGNIVSKAGGQIKGEGLMPSCIDCDLLPETYGKISSSLTFDYPQGGRSQGRDDGYAAASMHSGIN
jgi:hypothetical protein